MFHINPSIENQQVQLAVLEEKQVELWIKREDQIHTEVSGNKFRKLKYNVFEAEKLGYKTLLTFGGAYSNHIAATAAAAYEEGFKSVGVIRGDELVKNLEQVLKTNATLKLACDLGMQFYFVSREQYRQKNSSKFLSILKDVFGDYYMIPEGGTNSFAIKGCQEILTEQDKLFDVVCSAVGTGGTIAGIINSVKPHQQVLGFPALKGDFLNKEIQKYAKKDQWKLIQEYHFGGYAKYNEELIRFINEFNVRTKIPLDPIYTGKMLFGILDLVKNDYFRNGTKILAIHTGGLQGIEGFNQMLAKKKSPLRIDV